MPEILIATFLLRAAIPQRLQRPFDPTFMKNPWPGFIESFGQAGVSSFSSEHDEGPVRALDLSDKKSGGVAPDIDGGKDGVPRNYYQRPVPFSSGKTGLIRSKAKTATIRFGAAGVRP